MLVSPVYLSFAAIKNDRPAKEADLSEILKKPSAKFSENPIKIRFELRKVVLTSSVPQCGIPVRVT